MREMLVHVYGDNVIKKIAVYKWLTLFLKEEKLPQMEIRAASNEHN
jgi:hypothetical protein